jgi:hypothetical protein
LLPYEPAAVISRADARRRHRHKYRIHALTGDKIIS